MSLPRLAFAICCVLSVSGFAGGAAKKKNASQDETLQPVAVQRLREHLTSAKRDVFSEPMGEELVWTDKAIIERTSASALPKPLKTLLESSKAANGPAPGVMGALLQDAELKRAEWKAATLRHRPDDSTRCDAVNEKISALVNCVYVNYLEVRYPRGTWLVKGPLEMVLFVEGERVRGAVMPMKN